MIRRLLSILVLALLSVSGAQAAQLVVIESTSSKLPPGSIVEAAKPLALSSGERVTLVGEDGTVVRLTGPSSAAPAAGDAAAANKGVVQALSRLFAANQPSPSAWGTFRGRETLQGREAINPPEVWAVNLLRSDNVCVPTGIEPALWRPDPAREMVVVLLHLSTGKEAEIEFASGQQTLPWPKSVPLLDGGEYAVRDVGNLWERRLFVRIIPAEESNEVQQIAWMSDAGCLRQARAMVAHLE